MNNSAAQLSRLFANLAQQVRSTDRLIRASQQQTVGRYADYNADTGQHTVMVRQGGIDRPIQGRLITNAGLSAGQPIVISRGRSVNWFKAKPR